MMSQTQPTPDDASPDSGACYESVRSRVEHNTGGYQPPIAPKPSITAGVVRCGHQPDAVESAISKLCQDGDLFRWRDSRDGTLYLGIDDIETLRAKISSYATRRDDPRQDLIGIANQRTDYLLADGEDDV